MCGYRYPIHIQWLCSLQLKGKRREPFELYPWDGVAEVRPFGAMQKKIVEGVY